MLFVVLRLTEKTKGNACGIGYADITVKKLIDQIDFFTTYINTFTGGSGDLFAVKMPVVMKTDKEAIALAIKLSHCRVPNAVRLVRIKNTNKLDDMLVSESIYHEIIQNDNVEIADSFEPMRFDNGGNLL